MATDVIDSIYDHFAIIWHRTYGTEGDETVDAVPSAAEYKAAFLQGGISDEQLRLLRLHYAAPERTITASQMAKTSGYEHHSAANGQYGRLGRVIGSRLEYNPMKEKLGTLVTFDKRGGEWHWIMRPQVAQAIEQLGWVQLGHAHTADVASAVVPVLGEVSASEGRELLRLHRTRERNRGLVARKKQSALCEAGRLLCETCDFDFVAVYGPRGDGFAECHHTQPISQSVAGRRTSLSELALVCANCHRMLHRRPWVSVPELRAIVRSRRGE